MHKRKQKFTGTAYLSPMINNDEIYHFPQTDNVTFDPGARSGWHSHGGSRFSGTIDTIKRCSRAQRSLRMDIPFPGTMWETRKAVWVSGLPGQDIKKEDLDHE